MHCVKLEDEKSQEDSRDARLSALGPSSNKNWQTDQQSVSSSDSGGQRKMGREILNTGTDPTGKA